MIRTLLAMMAALCASLLLVAPAAAQLRVTVTEGTTEAMPIAIPDFEASGEVGGELGVEMAAVVRADLESSGLFRSLDPESFIQQDVNLDYVPVFADWRVIKSDALVVGRIREQGDGKILVEFRLFDVFGAEQLTGMRFSTPRENWRRIAHKVADAIYSELTGETGYFDSRVAFIQESGPKTNRRKRLALMDQDGANKVLLPVGSDLVLTPRFDPASQTLTYLSYEDVKPKVYTYDIASNRRELLGSFPGMTYAPRFTPDGKGMLLTIDRDNNADIYLLDLNSRSTKRLTTNPANDVSASFAPRLERLVFNSDRGGSPQLYTMNPDGSDVKRISFGKGRYTTPVWSPRGDKIAFTRQLNGKFAIGIMDPDGKNERILSEAWGNEGPTWSPNGRVVMFFRSERGSGKATLYAVDITGRNLRKVETGGNASDPAWSALLSPQDTE